MKKILFAMIASLATLVATSAGAQATFTVSIVIDGGAPITPAIAPGAGSINGSTFTLNQTYLTGAPGEGVSITINTTATEATGVSRLNTASVTIANGGPSTRSVVVTISQDAYQFSSFAKFTSPVVVTSLNTGGTSSVSSFAQSIGTYSNSPVALGVNQNFLNGSLAVAVTGPNPSSIVQVFSVSNFATGSFTSFADNSSVTLVTPLPATALMAGLGFPLLGLAVAARRRLFA